MKKIKSFEVSLTNAAGSKGQFALNDKVEKGINESLGNQKALDEDKKKDTDKL